MIFIKNLTLLIIFWEQSISILENFTVHISSLLIDEIKMKPNDIDFPSDGNRMKDHIFQKSLTPEGFILGMLHSLFNENIICGWMNNCIIFSFDFPMERISNNTII